MRTLFASKPVFFLEPSSFHHALCTLIITTLALGTLHFFLTPQASWLLLSTLLLSQAGLSAEANWQKPWKTLFYLYCGLLTAATVFLISLTAFSFLASIPLLFLISLTAGYFGWSKRQHYFPAFTLILCALIAAFTPCDLNNALERAYLILLGSFLVFSIRFLYFLYQRAHVLYYAKTLFFQKLKQFYQLIFYTSGQRRPRFGSEVEESHFQILWSDCLSALRSLKLKAPENYSHNLDRIWDLTLSLGSLRYRLTDFTVLTMSQDEMQALLKIITTLLDGEWHPLTEAAQEAAFDAFEKAILNFEELYRSMLQTVAKEPLVLLLFIQDLYALKEVFESLERSERSRRTS